MENREPGRFRAHRILSGTVHRHRRHHHLERRIACQRRELCHVQRHIPAGIFHTTVHQPQGIPEVQRIWCRLLVQNEHCRIHPWIPTDFICLEFTDLAVLGTLVLQQRTTAQYRLDPFRKKHRQGIAGLAPHVLQVGRHDGRRHGILQHHRVHRTVLQVEQCRTVDRGGKFHGGKGRQQAEPFLHRLQIYHHATLVRRVQGKLLLLHRIMLGRPRGIDPLEGQAVHHLRNVFLGQVSQETDFHLVHTAIAVRIPDKVLLGTGRYRALDKRRKRPAAKQEHSQGNFCQKTTHHSSIYHNPGLPRELPAAFWTGFRCFFQKPP